MSAGYQALTEKEKQTLRLIVRGHDAKSMARHLGLSVYTVNERLRDARRKLEVSSSREAARLLLNEEGGDPQKLGDKRIGDAADAQAVTTARAQGVRPSGGAWRPVWLIAGVVIMSVVLGFLALAVVPQSTTTSASSQAPASAQVAEAEVVRAARDWLVLHDEGRWRETYDGTTKSFRRHNTLQSWTQVAEKVRPPLGPVISRVLISEESVPAPAAGVEVVKFRTRFANKADAVETVSLAREDRAWKVVGIYIE